MVHPLNDRLKIELDKDEFGLENDKTSAETGIVVEVPDVLLYLSFHNFGFDNSIGEDSRLDRIQDFYNQLKGKRVWWEKLQDSGRHMKEGTKEYVYLQMTDVLAYSDDINEQAEILASVGTAQSFNLE